VHTSTNLFSLLVCAAISLLAIDVRAADLRLRSGWLDADEPGQRLAKDDDDDDDDDEDSKKKKSSKKKSGKSTSSGSGSSSSGVNIGSQSSAGGVSPEGKQMGVGLQIGSPTGLTGKYMLTGNQGVVAGVGAGLGGLSVHLDYLWHPQVLAVADPFRLSWYLGLGGWLGFFPYPNGVPGLGYFGPNFAYGYYNGHLAFMYLPYNLLWFAPSFAVRVPLGLSLALRQLPIEIYGGLTPSVLVFPGIGFGLGGEIGGRIYF